MTLRAKRASLPSLRTPGSPPPKQGESSQKPKVTTFPTIQYADTAQRGLLHWRHPQTLDIIVPDRELPDPLDPGKSAGGLPVIVFVHGGAWLTISDLFDQQLSIIRPLAKGCAQAGYVVALVRYRTSRLSVALYVAIAAGVCIGLAVAAVMILGLNGTILGVSNGVALFWALLLALVALRLSPLYDKISPPVQHPDHANDVASAVRWVSEHVAEERFGGDPTRVHLVGHSAGGHLAALVALDPTYLDNAECLRDCKAPQGEQEMEESSRERGKGEPPRSPCMILEWPSRREEDKGSGPRPFTSSSLCGSIIISGVLNLPRLRAMPLLGPLIHACLLEPVFGDADLYAASPVAHAATASCPMLFVTAKREFIVHDIGFNEDAKALSEAIESANHGAHAQHLCLDCYNHFTTTLCAHEMKRAAFAFFSVSSRQRVAWASSRIVPHCTPGDDLQASASMLPRFGPPPLRLSSSSLL